jgi:hypothetical protein
MKNTLTLALSLCALSLLGSCTSNNPQTGTDDLAMSTPDLSTSEPDLATPADLAFSPPDLTMLCGHGQTMNMMACACDAAHMIACGGARHCCAASPVNQQCLTTGAFGETRCSGPVAGRGQGLLVYNPTRGESILRSGICDTGGSDVLCPDQWRFGAVTWDPMGTVAGPSARYNSAMVYDGRSKNLLLFGGLTVINNENAVNGELWSYDGAAWRQLTIAGSPPARGAHAMAYDSTRGIVVLFGGLQNAVTALNDTWEFDGTRWQQRSTINTPMPREAHRMVYDTKRQRVVMVAGLVTGVASRETWSYDGSDWTRLSDNMAMAPRFEPAMTYDEERGVVVLFGGRDATFSNALNDLWEFDGTSWMRKTVAGAPSARAGASMTYDAARKLVLMYGGDPINAAQLKDLWAWNGTTWTQMYQ